jgi:hypothetical protein
MIIRDPGDGGLILIPQTDHSRLVGQLGAHWGNSRFARPRPYESVSRGAAFHDYGWLRYETSPLFNADTGETFEFRRAPANALQLEGYEWCFDWLLGPDPFASLLVNRHRTGLWRARYGALTHPAASALSTLPEQVEAYIVRNEARQARELQDVDPQQFAIAYRLLQVWDLLGLYFCCQDPAHDFLDPVPTGEDDGPGDGVRMTLEPLSPHKVRFDPYPFDEPSLHIQLVRRRLKQSRWATQADFRADYFKSQVELVDFVLVG